MEANLKSKEMSITIIVAIIGLCGVFGAAVINNWDKLFPTPTPPPPTQISPTISPTITSTIPPASGSSSGPASTCNGANVGGACWYFGPENASCTAVCSSHGGYSDATKSYAGSSGSASNCQNVISALNIPLDNFYSTSQGGLGCFAIQTTSGNYFGYWDKHPTTADATYSTPGRRRICACLR